MPRRTRLPERSLIAPAVIAPSLIAPLIAPSLMAPSLMAPLSRACADRLVRACADRLVRACAGRLVHALLVAALLLPLAAGPAAAQLLRGRVIHAGDGLPVPDVAVLILSDTTVVQAIVTDGFGHFETTLARPGTYHISASRAGYQTVGPARLDASEGRMLDLVIRMADNIVVLDPLEVRASRQPATRLDEARERIQRNRRYGIGIHMTRAEISASQRSSMSDLLRFRRSTERTRCTPALFVDGARVHDYVDDLDGIITPDDVEALEVYSGPHVRGGFYDPAGCGLLLVWSRRDARGNYKFTWIGSGIIAGVLTVIYLGW